jgi:hypothetical protein
LRVHLGGESPLPKNGHFQGGWAKYRKINSFRIIGQCKELFFSSFKIFNHALDNQPFSKDRFILWQGS